MDKYDILDPDFLYHIFNRGNNKVDLCKENGNYIYFLKLLKTYIDPIADVYSYCLLKNHFHLLKKVKSQRELDLKDIKIEKISQNFSNFFNAYTKAINKKYNREGSLFSVRYKRERITDGNYLKNVISQNIHIRHTIQ